MSKRQHQSCFVEPAKKDIPMYNFCKFYFNKYNVDLLQLFDKYDQDLIPMDMAFDPMNVNQHKSNDRYMRLECVLLSIFCLHHKYYHLNIALSDFLKNMLCFGKLSLKNGRNLAYPITARVIKNFCLNNGASNSIKVTNGDFGFTKPKYFDNEKQCFKTCNKYGRVASVMSLICNKSIYACYCCSCVLSHIDCCI